MSKLLQNMSAAKEEYFSKLLKAIKHGSMDAYRKLFLQNPDYLENLPYAERQELGLKDENYSSSALTHLHLVALYCQDILVFKKVLEYREYLGLDLYEKREPSSRVRDTPSILNFLLLNKNKFLFSSTQLEELFNINILFTKSNFNPYHHKLSFLAELKQAEKINSETYNSFFDLLFDESFKKTFPVYFNFTKEEIKAMNLTSTINSGKEPRWLECRDVEEMALKVSKRKSKQIKKALMQYCFSSMEKKQTDRFLNTLWALKDKDDQMFYWALNLYAKLPTHFTAEELVMVINNFQLFKQNSEVTVAQKRVEKLFELDTKKNIKPKAEEPKFRDLFYSEEDFYTELDVMQELDRFRLRDAMQEEVQLRLDDAYFDEVTDASDIIRMMQTANHTNVSYDIKNFDTAKELHDFLVLELESVKTKNLELKQVEISALDKVKFDQFEITVPTMSHDFKKVGRMLNICVGTASYDKKVINKQCCIVFLNLNAKVVGCIEFVNGKVIQMKGKHNQNFPRDLEKKFTEMLRDKYEKGEIKMTVENIIFQNDLNSLLDAFEAHLDEDEF